MSQVGPIDFEPIVEILNRRRVRYVVIGGVAAILHGAELGQTLDIDITPARDQQNLKRLAAALRDLDAKLRAPGLDEPVEIPLDERTFTGMITMTFVTRYGPLDISFIPDGTQGYDDLSAKAVTLERGAMTIPVAAVADIVRSKQAAGRGKDAEHLKILMDYLEQDEA